MLALWIIIAVVVVVALATTATVAVRRRRPPAPRPGKAAPSAPPRPARPPAAPPSATPTRAPPTEGALAGGAPAEPAPAGMAPAGAETAAGIETRGGTGAEAEAPPVEAPSAPPSFRERLGKARGLLSGYVGGVRARGRIDQETWDELEEALIRADVGVAATTALLDELRTEVTAGRVRDPEALLAALRAHLVATLQAPAGDASAQDPRALAFDDTPGITNVWLFVGVNGVGKTTTVGKVARRERQTGRSVLLAAGDTFRAAAGEQLAQWAERTGAEIVRGAEGGDPSAIVFDAVQRANARRNDLVLADTAGRLHTKVNLVEELKKIRRVADRRPGRVTEVLLVLDATTGQNAIAQARQFGDAVAVTGIVLTKLDGTAKGGVVVAVQRELGVPVKLVGLGEGPDDLVPFEPEAFVEALFA